MLTPSEITFDKNYMTMSKEVKVTHAFDLINDDWQPIGYLLTKVEDFVSAYQQRTSVGSSTSTSTTTSP